MLPNQAGQSLTASEVLAFARRYIGETYPVGYCQKFVRMAYGSGGGAPTAVAAWSAANVKHTSGEPKVGAAVFWGGGAGHVAIYAGNGMVISTDAPEAGRIGLVDMDYITKQWGKPYLGWSADNNGKTITSWDAKPVSSETGGGKSTMRLGATAGDAVATSDELSMKELAQSYGFPAAFYKQNAELRAFIKKAVKEQWTPEEAAARFQNTNYYRKHSDAEKEWDVLRLQRPGEAQRQLREKKGQVVELYRKMGVAVPPTRLDELTRQAVVHGWSDDELQDAIAAEFDYKPGQTYGGVIGQSVDDLRAMSKAYLVPLSNKTMDQWVTNILRGEATPDDFKSYMQAQAKSMWDDPGVHNAIDSGVTVDQYLNPYRELAAQTLGVNPESIDWTKDQWRSGIFQTDPKTGQRTMQSLASWGRSLRSESKYGFDSTAPAVNAANNLGSKLSQLLAGT